MADLTDDTPDDDESEKLDELVDQQWAAIERKHAQLQKAEERARADERLQNVLA